MYEFDSGIMGVDMETLKIDTLHQLNFGAQILVVFT